MNADDSIKLPRLYLEQELHHNATVQLPEAQSHYLRAVLRRNPGDRVRLFNGRQGEWLAVLETVSKKAVTARLEEQRRTQPSKSYDTHLYFAPVKKNRMDWLVEKAVELGATHLHPVITQNTEARQFKEDRVRQQIIEAAEQCERLDVPVLAEAQSLSDMLERNNLPLLACLERDSKALPLMQDADLRQTLAVLVGPEGGFTEAETNQIRQAAGVIPVSLGVEILRCETACCLVLGSIKLARLHK
jgi:16S rRNA (uracil1498-N3)-methyltransferase